MKTITYDEWYELIERIKELEGKDSGLLAAIVVFSILFILCFCLISYISIKHD